MKNIKIKIEGRITKALVFSALFMFFFFPAFSASAKEISVDNVLSLINQSRMLYGTNIVKTNELLMKAANEKMNDMFSKNYFSHTSPEGKTPWYWVEKSGYDYKYAGENLAIDFKSAERQHKAWMESATHRKNILNSNYQEVGIAVGEGRIDGKETILTVQLFGTQNNAPVAAEEPASKTGDVQGEEKIPAEPVPDQTIYALKDSSHLQLPENEPIVSTQNGYTLIDKKQFSRDLAWASFVIILALSFLVDAHIVKHIRKRRSLILAN